MQRIWSVGVVASDGVVHSRKLLAPGEILTIGRTDCDIVLEHVSVSRKHAQLALTGNRCVLRCTGAKFGTKVNGGQVDNEVDLKPGDVCILGVCSLQVVIHGVLASESSIFPFRRLNQPMAAVPAEPLGELM